MSPLILVPILGFVQSQNRTVHTMIPWFQDPKWTPVLCGSADHPDFLWYMSLAGNTAGPWFKQYSLLFCGTWALQGILLGPGSSFPVFGELGLNNAGRRAAKEDCKVLCQPFHPLPHLAVWLNTRLQVEAKAARAVRRAHQKAGKKRALRLGQIMTSLLQTSHPSFRLLVSQHNLGPLEVWVQRSAAFPLRRGLPWRLPWCPFPATLRLYQVLRQVHSLQQRSLHPWTLMRLPTFRVIGEAQILCFAVLYTGGSDGPTRDQVKAIFFYFRFSVAVTKTGGWTTSLFHKIIYHTFPI